MDYVAWCDSLASELAEYAEKKDRWVNLQMFAREVAKLRNLNDGPVDQAILTDTAHLLQVIGTEASSVMFRLQYADLERLKDGYSRWGQAFDVDIDDTYLAFIATLNGLSQVKRVGYTTVEEVDLEQIVSAIPEVTGQGPITSDQGHEMAQRLKQQGFAQVRNTIGNTSCRSSYLGVVRTNRTSVIEDRQIDQLRTAGEGDALDYKRIYKLGTKEQNLEFARDTVALANAGGDCQRHILVGVEDNGEFFRPATDEERVAHQQLLDNLTETRIQQIVGSRTTHTPSIRIPHRGQHRDGPYVLIEILRDIANLPYRVYDSEGDRSDTSADELGEVWIRKGSTKSRATASEIESLRSQAALYVSIRRAFGTN